MLGVTRQHGPDSYGVHTGIDDLFDTVFKKELVTLDEQLLGDRVLDVLGGVAPQDTFFNVLNNLAALYEG